MNEINVTVALRRLLRVKVLTPSHAQDYRATLAATRIGIQALLDVLEPSVGIESLTIDEGETGPENSREEVVGTSTRRKSSNTGNSGFSGGRPRLVA